MEESDDNISADDSKVGDMPLSTKSKPKKRSLVERELETSLTARVTSPVTNGDGSSTSRYGRTRRLKTDSDYSDSEKSVSKVLKSPIPDVVTPAKTQPTVYKMHASNSPVNTEASKQVTPKRISVDSSLDNQIENIYNENISLCRFSSEEKQNISTSGKVPKVYVRKDLIQTRENRDSTDNCSSSKSISKSTNSHLNNIMERSSEKYDLNNSISTMQSQNGYLDTSSVVKTLDFDNTNKKKKDMKESKFVMTKSDLFELEAKCEYQVGDLAWARMGTYPYWPCIITREPVSGMFVKKKLFGRLERDVLHVTFFGDNGRRSWIVDTMLRKFLGQLEFETAREHFSPTSKKKDPRLYAAFFISEKKLPQWTVSVEEAEMLIREPKRLRIDILNDMLLKSRSVKSNKLQKSGKITRTASDVSLSESLYDSLFSEDDGKPEDPVRKSLDVCEVVTACLDNMAAKTGNSKIQRQSHMDRWLQKAKSKTPEKSQTKIQVTSKDSNIRQKKKSNSPKKRQYRLRTSHKFQNLQSAHYKHDFSVSKKGNDEVDTTRDCVLSDIRVITKVESLSEKMLHRNDEGTGDSMDSLESDVFTYESPTFSQPFDENVNFNIVNSIDSESTDQTESLCHSDSMYSQELEYNLDTSNKILQNGSVKDLKGSDKATGRTNSHVVKLDFGGETSSVNMIEQMDVDEDVQKENNTKVNDASVSVDSFEHCNGQSDSHCNSKVVNRANKLDKSEERMLELSKSFLKVKSTPVKKKRSLRLKKSQSTPKNKKTLEEAAFAKYLELHQDSVMDEHGELSHDEIVEYLRKTWQYEETSSGYTVNDLSSSIIGVSDNEKSYSDTLDISFHTSKERNDSESMEKMELKSPKLLIENISQMFSGEFHDHITKKANEELFADSDNIDFKIKSEVANNSNKKLIDVNCSEKTSNELEHSHRMLDKNVNKNNTNDNKKDISSKDENLRVLSKKDGLPCLNENDTGSLNTDSSEGDLVDSINKVIIQEFVDVTKHKTSLTNDTKPNISEKQDLIFTNSSNNAKINENEKTTLSTSQSTVDNSLTIKPHFETEDAINTIIENVTEKMNNSLGTNLTNMETDYFSQDKISKTDPPVKFVELGDESIQIHCAEKSTEVTQYSDTSNKNYGNALHGDAEKSALVEARIVCNGEDEKMDLVKSISETQVDGDETIEKVLNPIENEKIKDLVNVFSENDTSSKDNNSFLPVVNGLNYRDEQINDFSDGELNIETSSINSEDSEPLLNVKNKLRLNNPTKAIGLDNSEFIKYMELRQDDLMDTHPELNQQEVVEYLFKTWQYEENAKSDHMKADDIEQSGLVKGLNDNLRQKSIRNRYRESKKRKNKQDDLDSISVCSDMSDSSGKRKLRGRTLSPAVLLEDISKDNSPERKSIEDSDEMICISPCSSERSSRRSLRKRIFDEKGDSQSSLNSFAETDRDIKDSVRETNNSLSDTSTKNTEEIEKFSVSSENSSKKKFFSIFNCVQNKENNDHDDSKLEMENKIKEEYDPDILSIHSEDSEVSVTKRKQRKYGDKRTIKPMDDPEFLKYMEIRQDALIEENSQLSQDEIVSYLYKTWLYEESVKSDIKKADDFDQSNFVKGLAHNTETVPKKYKRKIKSEKDQEYEDKDNHKDKPKRKTSQHYYNEDLSDIEDEIELFDIFKQKPKTESPKGVKKLSSADVDKVETEVIDSEEEMFDEVELYFEELTKPKPNLFKGLFREKVCEICERTGNIVKCKGCHSMFHVECVKKEMEVVEVPAPAKGRKKKKRLGRKPKCLEDSGSHSDEKSQDVSEEMNASLDDELETFTFDADNFEAVLEAKMKELLPSDDANYNSFSSAISLDWRGTVPGKCEIVDVNLSTVETPDYADYKCNNCQKYDTPVCFVCKSSTSKKGVLYRQRCQTTHCWKYYHLECLDHWPQTQFNSGEPSKNNKNINERFEEFVCPRHVCHTCVSDDPRGCKTRFSGDKLARCVRCPATYHTFTKCLPAGTQILTGSHIVCPRHYEHRPGKVPCHVNTGWCFICALGGSLICCEYCPTSFHAECLNIKPPEGGYMCEDCETGRLPLYGEMVWVKLGHYRWWPGIILHPAEIPENIMAVKHSQGEFVVRFFGQYDHYWVNRGRVFPFQEGDSGRVSGQKSKIDAAFTTAMEHAQRACEILKAADTNEEEDTDIASSLLPPHYVKLKVNKPCGSLCGRRVDIEESSLSQCECNPDEEEPCGPYSQCLNRMLLTECGPTCRAGDRCNNRAFEKRLYPKMVPYRTPHRGWGLKTLQEVKAGQFVIEYVGELIDEEEFRRRMNRKHEIRDENFYFLTLDKERMIDAGPKGNLARFMNHCCEPNCETQKWTVLGDVRVGLFALSDIPANSELTFNYNLECAGIEKKKCMCGARRCSGYIGAKPKQEESQTKKNKMAAKRAYKKRKNVEDSPSTSKNKPKRPVGRPAKPRELTEIEKDLLIIKNATNGLSSDSEASGRLSSIDSERTTKALKRKRVSFSTEDALYTGHSPTTKKTKVDEKSIEVGD